MNLIALVIGITSLHKSHYLHWIFVTFYGQLNPKFVLTQARQILVKNYKIIWINCNKDSILSFNWVY